jgi:hypothetical protein
MKKILIAFLISLTIFGCGVGREYEVEITYFDNEKEILTMTQVYDNGNDGNILVTMLNNGCTHQDFAPSRCHVKRVKVIKKI